MTELQAYRLQEEAVVALVDVHIYNLKRLSNPRCFLVVSKTSRTSGQVSCWHKFDKGLSSAAPDEETLMILFWRNDP